MTHSPKALALAMEFEGCKLTAYQDGAGVWTLGYGHTAGVQEGQTCTQGQALEWLDEDLRTADAAVNRFVTVSLNQNQYDALVDFVYNLGAGALEHSTLLKLLNSGQSLAAAAQFSSWDHVGTEVEPGLLTRRLAERDLFLEAV